MSNKKEEEEEGFWRLAALDGDRFGNEQIKLLEDLKAEEINEVKSDEVAPIFYDSIYQLSLISPKRRVSFKGTVSQIGDLRNAEIHSDTPVKNLEIVVSDQSNSIRVNIYGVLADNIARSLTNGRQISIQNGLLRMNTYFNYLEILCYNKTRVVII